MESVEEQQDEAVLVESKKVEENLDPLVQDEASNVHNIASNTRTIKISFGPQGKLKYTYYIHLFQR